MGVTPDAIRQLLDELEANRRSPRTAWSTLQRLRKFLEENGTRIGIRQITQMGSLSLSKCIAPWTDQNKL